MTEEVLATLELHPGWSQSPAIGVLQVMNLSRSLWST